MSVCLVGLGSNLGDRAQTLSAAALPLWIAGVNVP